ncbi:single-stranded DNA-binding protein [Paraburkholderia fungorum]|jgi:single-stranded DNA-binding protein|uniref:Single-stranded DNA-binding protein n=1 Tax=Paraburkholderia fungorum TaxID=134537 RepID=A0AAP5UUJ4_9BURK|nr:single-stranded DNA-binding protein [Paraburkholderia fungorum]MDT8839595.1 single-stranded DNA-binding protein [Paraburkholderia fungorum]PRZ52752.1 single-stranded DNA-binding protein [Paraburkholderia fungorum]
MIDGLVGGRLYGEAQIRTGQNGKRFVTCKVRATTNDGDTIFVNVIAFDDEVQAALLALGDADSVALSGALTPKVWTDKNGLVKPAVDMVAHKVLVGYQGEG